MSAVNPTILIIHGSWHTPAHFAPLQSILTEQSYPSLCPPQATINSVAPIGLKDDVAIYRDMLRRLIAEESKHVIVVGHSYGCVVATECVDEEYGVAQRKAEGKEGGVIGLVFMCGFVVEKGMSLSGAFGGAVPPFLEFHDDGSCTTKDSINTFYHDLTPDQQQHWLAQLVSIPKEMPFEVISQASYMYHPLTYLYCSEDRGLPLFLQQMMVKGVEGKTGITIKEEHCNASHSPFLSMPERVVEVLKKVHVDALGGGESG